MSYTDSDNGALPSNTRHCAPLELGGQTHHDSIDIAQDLLWEFYRTPYAVV